MFSEKNQTILTDIGKFTSLEIFLITKKLVFHGAFHYYQVKLDKVLVIT